MNFSKDNLNITSAFSLIENENSTSYDLTENFITGNDTITGNGTASTEQTVGNVTTPTDSPLQEYDYLNPVWNVAFSATVITGTAGNLIVLWIVLGKKYITFLLTCKYGRLWWPILLTFGYGKFSRKILF